MPRGEVTQVRAGAVEVLELAPGDLLAVHLDAVNHVVDDEQDVAPRHCVLGGLEDAGDRPRLAVDDEEEDLALRLGVGLELDQTLVPVVDLRVVEGHACRLEGRHGSVLAPGGRVAASAEENLLLHGSVSLQSQFPARMSPASVGIRCTGS